MAPGQEEVTVPPHGILRPTVDFFRSGRQEVIDVPSTFQTQFLTLAEGIYPHGIIKKLKEDEYNPVIIGTDHPRSNNDLPDVKKLLTSLKEKDPTKTLKVAHEIIPPIQLQWIKDFPTVVEEYRTKGTIYGKIPDHTPEDQEAYRAKLNRNHAENLALWMLEQGFEVIPLDSPYVEKWIEEDGITTYGDTRQALTAIKRDIYGLQIMAREKPDVITTGSAHALKYDILLGRGGSNSYYFWDRIGDWNDILRLWQAAHTRYRAKSGLPTEKTSLPIPPRVVTRSGNLFNPTFGLPRDPWNEED